MGHVYGILIAASILTLSPAWADPTQPMLNRIECSGKTSDDRAVQIAIVVDAGTVSYPAPVTARLQLGADSPETLSAKLNIGTESDEDGSRMQHVFHVALDLHRGFTARTSDLRTGTANLKLENAIQASQLVCSFTTAVEAASRSHRPTSKR